MQPKCRMFFSLVASLGLILLSSLSAQAQITIDAQQLMCSYASAAVVGGKTIGGVTTFGAPVIYRQGLGPYNQPVDGVNRWGDYSAATRDPSNTSRFWVDEEWANTGNRWSTQITSVTVGNGGALTFGNFGGANSFTGSIMGTDSNFRPPDTNGAIGPSHFTEIINGRFKVFNKATGAQVQSMTLDDFWNTAITNGGGATKLNGTSFDPRVLYDPASGRWFAVSADNIGNNNNFLIAVSDTNDPTGTWKGFAANATPTNRRFFDFPTLGINGTGVFLAGNNFSTGAMSAFTGTNIIVIPKADLIQAMPTIANTTIFEDQALANTGGSPQPVVDPLGTAAFPERILSAINVPAGRLKASQITNTAANPMLNTMDGSINVNPFPRPPGAQQPDGPLIDAGDPRFSASVVLVDGNLWAVDDVNINGRDGIRWYEIDAATNNLLQQGSIADPLCDFYYPAISVNSAGDVVIGFTVSSVPEPGSIALFASFGLTGAALLARRRSARK